MSRPTLPHLTVSVTGLGYVGLPAALAFASRYHVVAYDHSPERVAMLRGAQDPCGVVGPQDFASADIEFTADENLLANANFHIVATPTPVDVNRNPDISLLKKAISTIARHLKKGDTVVVESTVYPGCVEEELQPILESVSGLKAGTGFTLGYSPERINPGDSEHTFTTVRKIVAATSPEGLERVAAAYQSVVKAGVFRASSIKVAEAAKIIENTQRDVNIALMNELSVIFARMGIETADVLAAASTKWNFLPFHPGLVGGHCIGVDPYYLDYKARELNYHTQIINRGRFVNDSMGQYVAKQTVKRLLAHGGDVTRMRILLMGLAYKADVQDVRNSRAVDILDELRSFNIGTIDVVDPVACKSDSLAIYGFQPQDHPSGVYDAIVVCTAHSCFRSLGQLFFDRHLRQGGVLSDVYSLFRGVRGFDSWRL